MVTLADSGHGAHSRADFADVGYFILRGVVYLVSVFLISAVFVFVVEWLARGSFSQSLAFITSAQTGALATVGLVSCILLVLDALLGRSYQAICVFGLLFLALPFSSFEKLHYLSDPLFPTDFLFIHQVVDILPLLIGAHPFLAIGAAVGVVLVAAFLVGVLFFWRRYFPPMSWKSRFICLVIALPPLAFLYSISDYATYSWTRDRLHVIPMMWDQKANYAHNGFIMAFALNVPMSRVDAPAGYGADTMNAMKPAVPVSGGKTKPDVIVIMNESFWDPTKLPGVTITPDPMPTVRKMQSGYMFSPEFGGMTADIEFEALTGFSNAFLPYGSIPYQQDIHRPMPSLARFFNGQGYTTRAIHPFQAWFWNRGNVYRDFDFDLFKSQENLPKLNSLGPLASDAALTKEVIKEADSMKKPFFYYVVTLQNHGPYEAHRYKTTHVKVSAPKLSEDMRQSALSYAEGVHDADAAFKQLVDWAKKRKRETILVFFGDHLPPLSGVYVQSGFLKHNVAPRKAPVPDMIREHGTPLVVWSNRTGSVNTGVISPSLIPREILKLAGMTHPYYTGFLGKVHDQYHVVERQLLLKPDGKTGVQDWVEKTGFDPVIDQYRRIQYDMMFGKEYARDTYFPSMKKGGTDRRPQVSSLGPVQQAASD